MSCASAPAAGARHAGSGGRWRWYSPASACSPSSTSATPSAPGAGGDVAHLVAVARGDRPAAFMAGSCAGLGGGTATAGAVSNCDRRSSATACLALFICTGMVLRVDPLPCRNGRARSRWSTTADRLRFWRHVGGGAGESTRPRWRPCWRCWLTLALTLAGRRHRSGATPAGVNNARRWSAIGAGHLVICQRARGFTGGLFNTREFFPRPAPGTLRTREMVLLVSAACLRWRRCWLAPWSAVACWPWRSAGSAGRALVLRAGQPPAEPLLPGHLVKRAGCHRRVVALLAPPAHRLRRQAGYVLVAGRWRSFSPAS